MRAYLSHPLQHPPGVLASGTLAAPWVEPDSEEEEKEEEKQEAPNL